MQRVYALLGHLVNQAQGRHAVTDGAVVAALEPVSLVAPAIGVSLPGKDGVFLHRAKIARNIERPQTVDFATLAQHSQIERGVIDNNRFAAQSII